MDTLAYQLRRSHQFLVQSSFYPLLLSTMLACVFYAGRAYLTTTTVYVFLILNLVLAWVPYLASVWASMLHRYFPRIWWFQLAPGAIWLFFFPNGPYILTDLIHLRKFTEFVWWYDVGLIVTFAWTGLFLAIASLHLMQTIVRSFVGSVLSWLFVLISLGLSGLGVYLGRFLRWNSWDLLLAPREVLDSALASVLFSARQSLGVTAMFAAFLLVSYVMFLSMRSAAGPRHHL
jgi:uncharacterized membrane protein